MSSPTIEIVRTTPDGADSTMLRSSVGRTSLSHSCTAEPSAESVDLPPPTPNDMTGRPSEPLPTRRKWPLAAKGALSVLPILLVGAGFLAVAARSGRGSILANRVQDSLGMPKASPGDLATGVDELVDARHRAELGVAGRPAHQRSTGTWRAGQRGPLLVEGMHDRCHREDLLVPVGHLEVPRSPSRWLSRYLSGWREIQEILQPDRQRDTRPYGQHQRPGRVGSVRR